MGWEVRDWHGEPAFVDDKYNIKKFRTKKEAHEALIKNYILPKIADIKAMQAECPEDRRDENLLRPEHWLKCWYVEIADKAWDEIKRR